MYEKDKFTLLSNGTKIPRLGFGTYKLGEGLKTVISVKEALRVGYRHIDTAAFYGNEEEAGLGIKESQVPRDEIFLTSKVWKTDMGYVNTLKAFETSLKKLDTSYLDLYLIHWPSPLAADTWRALEKLYKEGKVRAIGVSNFTEEQLLKLMETEEVIPMVDQVELHPELNQSKLIEFCSSKSIQVEAWAPLARGRIFNYPILAQIAEKYDKSVPQIVLRWELQLGVIAIPKSGTPERIRENTDIFDFNLSEEDIKAISSLSNERRIGADPHDIIY